MTVDLGRITGLILPNSIIIKKLRNFLYTNLEANVLRKKNEHWRNKTLPV